MSGLGRKAWIEERVERYAASLCPSLWHDEGHSCHSSCPQCSRPFMRRHVVDVERQRLSHFADAAESYAREVLCV